MTRLITVDKEILGGVPVFTGSRVPIKNLLDYLEDGLDIQEFLNDFPSVKKEQIVQFLDLSVREYLTRHYDENIAG